MIRSLQAIIIRNGNVVRSNIARPDTVARYLATVRQLADYHVTFWYQGQSHRVTAEGFLALYGAGHVCQPPTLKEWPQPWRPPASTRT